MNILIIMRVSHHLGDTMPNQDNKNPERFQMNVLWICDCSSSMRGKGKAGSMNTIIREIVQEMAEIPEDTPACDILIRAIKFSDKAEWVNPSFIPVQEYVWQDLVPGGGSKMGDAFAEIARQFQKRSSKNGDRLIAILISDGYPTDDWKGSLDLLKKTLQAWDPIYCAVRIQDTADEVVTEFVGDGEDLEPRIMETDSIENIIHIIRASIHNE